MTLQNGLIHNGQAFLWSDTAWWDTATGRRIGTGTKILGGTLWPWVATMSGYSPPDDLYRVGNLLAGKFNITPDALVRDACEVLKIEKQAGRDNRLLLAWPDERRGARMFHIAAEELPGRQPLQAVELSKFLCWGAGQPWYEPYADRDMTPADMRECVALQLRENASAMFDGMEMEDPVSDVVETCVSLQGIMHTVYRLEGDRLCEVGSADGQMVSLSPEVA